MAVSSKVVDNMMQSGPGQDRQIQAKPKTLLCITGHFNATTEYKNTILQSLQ